MLDLIAIDFANYINNKQFNKCLAIMSHLRMSNAIKHYQFGSVSYIEAVSSILTFIFNWCRIKHTQKRITIIYTVIVMDGSTNNDNTNEIVWNVFRSYVEKNPNYLVRHHLDSYNDFFSKGIYQIFKDKNPLYINSIYDESTETFQHQAIMYMGGKDGTKIHYGKPMINDAENKHYMYPNEARLRNMTYSFTIHYDIDIEFIDVLEEGQEPDDNIVVPEDATVNQTKVAKEKTRHIRQPQRGGTVKHTRELTLSNIFLGKFPIMVQSNLCILSNLSKEVRYNMGECKNDMGGYFIIGGKEKTIISQEKFADNILYIRKYKDDTNFSHSAEIRCVSENVAKPIRTLSVKIVKPSARYTNNNIVVNIPNITKPVPLFIVFRALGILSDKDIIRHCLLDLEKYESMIDIFRPSIHDASTVMTQQSALYFISRLLLKNKTIPNVLEVLSDFLLPQIGELNFKEKALSLGHIVFRLLAVYIGIEPPTDRDNFKFKRIETSGQLIGDLFREYYTMQQKRISKRFEEQHLVYQTNIYANNLMRLVNDNYKTFFIEENLVHTGFSKAFRGNWGGQPHTKRIGVIQDLNRLSFSSAMWHLRKTSIDLDSSAKVVGPRLLQSSQWGYLDPIDTPDGASIGIHKTLTMFAYVSKSISAEPMIQWLREKVDMRMLQDCMVDTLSALTKIIVNGRWVGATPKPFAVMEKIKQSRRIGLLPIYISVTFEIQFNTIYVYTDAGRLCRPVYYVDKGVPSSAKLSYSTNVSWEDLVTGLTKKRLPTYSSDNIRIFEQDELYDATPKPCIVEYIDTSESENSLICLNKSEWDDSHKTKGFTHLEIHESVIFGLMCNQVIFPDNNPITRNSFSCGQTRQAVSMYHTNFQNRMDKAAVVLNGGHSPLVKSRYSEFIDGNENPYGQNTIVAIMCYTGYNVEDAILVNEGSLNRGMFRTTYYSTYSAYEEKTENGGDVRKVLFTDVQNNENVLHTKAGYDYGHLDKYGLVKENTVIDDRIVIIGMASSSSDSTENRDCSVSTKKGQLGIVDKVFITEGEEGQRIAKVRVREERIPNLGDKMASRAGQKGTVGLVIPERDMPFTKDGIRPDLIINPHAFPTRMTIGQLVETIVGKACLVYGGHADCTSFNTKGLKIHAYGEHLQKMGYHSNGNEILHNGMTGEPIETDIFIGPTYYMRLKHMVKDKINYRAGGPMTAMTRQPVSGRANDGGLRIGEMERDSLLGHGVMNFLRESMMERSDKYSLAICNKTGMIAVYNPSQNLFMSPIDGPMKFSGVKAEDLRVKKVTRFGRDFSVVNVPFAFKLFLQEMQCINIQMRIITEDNIGQIENMSFNPSNLQMLLHKPSTTNLKTIIDDANNDIQDAMEKGVKKRDNAAKRNVANQHQPPQQQHPEQFDGIFEENAKNAFANDYEKHFMEQEQYYEPQSPSDSPPRFQPQSPSDSPPRFQPQSPSDSPPRFQPQSPSDSPPRFQPQSPSDSPPRFQPQSPSDSPPIQMGGMSIGQPVFVHDKGYVQWTVTKIGNRFITVTTDDPSVNDDNVLVVDKEDIIPCTDELLMSLEEQQNQQHHLQPLHQQSQQQQPNITINLVNGDNNKTDLPATPVDLTETMEHVSPEPEQSPINEKIDFTKMVVRKI